MRKNTISFVACYGVLIMDLMQNMIWLSGAHGIEIIETDLRPGEKLYEELLVKTEELEKIDNNLILIERDLPLSREEIDEKIQVLRDACHTDGDDAVREALHQVVPTYRTPEEINADAINATEMKRHQQTVSA